MSLKIRHKDDLTITQKTFVLVTVTYIQQPSTTYIKFRNITMPMIVECNAVGCSILVSLIMSPLQEKTIGMK